MLTKPWRNTMVVEMATIITHQPWAGAQYQMRVLAPAIARRALPGQFVHVQCTPELPMRRPLSIMLTDPEQGWVDFLYKAVGHGTQQLARRQVGETLSLLGPIGQPFQPNLAQRPRLLLLGGGVGIPPMLFLAQHYRAQALPIVLMGSEVPFPFVAAPSQLAMPGLPSTVTHAMPLLESWQIPSRLASLQGYAGCYPGYVAELARQWLETQSPEERQRIEIFSCGPHPMLAAVAALARQYQLPCQVSLEEFMACAVGGCAGCVVAVQTATGTAMKRVCVDGPVFSAQQVLF